MLPGINYKWFHLLRGDQNFTFSQKLEKEINN